MEDTLVTDDFTIEIKSPAFPRECRICLDTQGELIEPCECKGSSGYVHLQCLNKWRLSFPSSHEKRNICEICKTSYQIPLGPMKHYFGYLVVSIVLFSCNLSFLVSGLCPLTPMKNDVINNGYCMSNYFVTIAHAAVTTCLISVKEEKTKSFRMMFFPQCMLITMVFFLDGFHIFLTFINLLYFFYNLILVARPDNYLERE